MIRQENLKRKIDKISLVRGLSFESPVEEYQKGFLEMFNQIMDKGTINTALEHMYNSLMWEHRELEFKINDRT